MSMNINNSKGVEARHKTPPGLIKKRNKDRVLIGIQSSELGSTVNYGKLRKLSVCVNNSPAHFGGGLVSKINTRDLHE